MYDRDSWLEMSLMIFRLRVPQMRQGQLYTFMNSLNVHQDEKAVGQKANVRNLATGWE